MRNKLIVIFIMFLVCGFVSAWEIEDVNGTWVYCEEHLKSPQRSRSNYYWGRGISIVDASLEIDLEPKMVRIPGMGLYIIDSISKDEQGAIILKTFYVGDKNQESPYYIEFTFIEYKKVYIICYSQNGWLDKRYSPEENWVWHRLSGPPQKPAPTPPAN